jgi:FtsH-binding integral membrane protein
MTRRTYRLLAPGLVFTAIGVLLLWLGPSPSFQLRGGLAMAGTFALVLQVVVSLFVITSIDDLGERRHDAGRRSLAPALTGQRDASLQRLTFPQAVGQFYLQSAVAMALFAFGLGASLSAIVDGRLADQEVTQGGSHPSEIVLAALLVAGAIFLAVAGTRAGYIGGYFGWCIGFAFAAVLVQERFVIAPAEGSTVPWFELVVILVVARILLWAVVKGVGWLRHRSHAAAATA